MHCNPNDVWLCLLGDCIITAITCYYIGQVEIQPGMLKMTQQMLRAKAHWSPKVYNSRNVQNVSLHTDVW